MFRRIMPALLVVLSLLIDISVIGIVWSHRFVPPITLMSVVVMGLLLGRTRGAMHGLVGGLLLDVSVMSPFGLMSLVFTGCGYLAGIAGRKYQRYALTPVIAPLLCFAIYELVTVVYLYMANVNIQLVMVRDALIRIGVAVASCQLMYLLYNRILRPSWSRFAAR